MNYKLLKESALNEMAGEDGIMDEMRQTAENIGAIGYAFTHMLEKDPMYGNGPLKENMVSNLQDLRVGDMKYRLLKEAAVRELAEEDCILSEKGENAYAPLYDKSKRAEKAARRHRQMEWRKSYSKETQGERAKELMSRMRPYKHPWEDDFRNGSRDITIGDRDYAPQSKEDIDAEIEDAWWNRGDIMDSAFDDSSWSKESKIDSNWKEAQKGLPEEPKESDFEWEGEKETLNRIDAEAKEIRQRRKERLATTPVCFAGFEFPDRKTAKSAIVDALYAVESAAEERDDGWRYNSIRNFIKHSLLNGSDSKLYTAEPGEELLGSVPMLVVTKNILLNDYDWMSKYSHE